MRNISAMTAHTPVVQNLVTTTADTTSETEQCRLTANTSQVPGCGWAGERQTRARAKMATVMDRVICPSRAIVASHSDLLTKNWIHRTTQSGTVNKLLDRVSEEQELVVCIASVFMARTICSLDYSIDEWRCWCNNELNPSFG